MKKETSLKDLKWVKLLNPLLLPIYLIEEVKGRTFSAEDLIKYLDFNRSNPAVLVYVLITKKNEIKGYLWAEMNTLDESIFINTFSIDKAYWHKGGAINIAIELIKELKNKVEATRVYWMTTNSRFFMKKGFKPSKMVLMEYKEGEEENGTDKEPVQGISDNNGESTIST